MTKDVGDTTKNVMTKKSTAKNEKIQTKHKGNQMKNYSVTIETIYTKIVTNTYDNVVASCEGDAREIANEWNDNGNMGKEKINIEMDDCTSNAYLKKEQTMKQLTPAGCKESLNAINKGMQEKYHWSENDTRLEFAKAFRDLEEHGQYEISSTFTISGNPEIIVAESHWLTELETDE